MHPKNINPVIVYHTGSSHMSTEMARKFDDPVIDSRVKLEWVCWDRAKVDLINLMNTETNYGIVSTLGPEGEQWEFYIDTMFLQRRLHKRVTIYNPRNANLYHEYDQTNKIRVQKEFILWGSKNIFRDRDKVMNFYVFPWTQEELFDALKIL